MQPVTFSETIEVGEHSRTISKDGDNIMPLALNLSLPRDPVLPRMLHRLSAAQCHRVFVLNAFLGRQRKLVGPSYHSQVADLLRRNINSENELQGWLAERFSDLPVRRPFFSKLCRQADRWLEEGLWVASWSDGALGSGHAGARCPQVLFGKGSIERDQLWSAFFNSRKGKAISPRAEWIQILRVLLPFMVTNNLGIAAGLGTATYDLVTAAAEQIGARVLLMIPTPLPDFNPPQNSPLFDAAAFPRLLLSCMTEAVNCPKPIRMVCRDRLLAMFSDLHCVLEVRPEGNLLKILEEQQEAHPRLRWIYRPEVSGSGNAGNAQLLQHSSPSAISFSLTDIGASSARGFPSAPKQGLHYPSMLLVPLEINWLDYLYHYVRPCPGPWPNQAYREYLMGLFEDKPLAGHTVLETLVYILFDGRIRASSKIVRGDQAVVSWTSRSPLELSAIRRWNPALMRWTLEPYGLAVKRGVLKKLGVKPVVYGASRFYERLPRDDRFRFQLHEPPRCSWKNEREWRLPGDLELKGVAVSDVFAFVPTASDAEAMAREIHCALPILVLADNNH
jgi:hypothetical protein